MPATDVLAELLTLPLYAAAAWTTKPGAARLATLLQQWQLMTLSQRYVCTRAEGFVASCSAGLS
jgi:uncharacterized membrane protein